MHPRVDFTRHYMFARFLDAGIGCLGANTRNPNNDINTLHEEIIRDVGACVTWLRAQGVERIVLLGNSGGGSLCAYYQAQADEPADAMIYVAAHPGQGRVLGDCIDPAVIDESDPLASDDALDMYHPDNGFETPPQPSSYDAAFVDRYRAAQRARVERLDAIARAHIARHKEARAAVKGGATDAASHRRMHFEPVMTIYRTMANLHYVDPQLDPSERDYGSLLSERPDLMNFKLLGFARVVTPRAWLSTWSATSSKADLLKTLPQITAPTLMVHAAADRELYPKAHIEPMEAAVAADDFTTHTIVGASHYFEAHRDALMDIVIDWVRQRF